MKKIRRVPRRRPESVFAIRAVIEVASIIFLFYSNLLMGEFTASSRPGKTWGFAFRDIFTVRNAEIALVSALVGFVVFEWLREKAVTGIETSAPGKDDGPKV